MKQSAQPPNAPVDVLALGAWLKNAACRLGPDGAQWSTLHGDLGEADACQALQASAEALLRHAPRPVAAIAHDLHPDFFSTRLAQQLAAQRGVPAIGVQHHHAHIAAVMAEHGLGGPEGDTVIGLALDGFGLGSDGTPWGGELLAVSTRGWQRLGHLRRLAMPGGDSAARAPWRMAAAALHALGRTDEIAPRFAARVGEARAQGVAQLLQRGLNCPASSSAGRWFDAAAGALGLCLEQDHEAQAAVQLEQCATQALAIGTPEPSGQTLQADAHHTLDLLPLLAPLFDTPAVQVPAAAAAFHHGLAAALATWATRAAGRLGTRTVCLGGGCWLNQVLSRRVTQLLQAQGLRVLRPQQLSCGDAGLALGQAWVAAHQLRQGPTASTLPLAPTADNPATTESLTCA